MVKFMYKMRTLSCGIRCICEKIPHVHSVSLGVRIAAGTRHESEEFWGISHFIEHMLFKGTKNRSAREIAEYTDNFGAQLNAFTARDNTCFYIKAMDSHFEKCFEILSDMLLESTFEAKEISRERDVVLEEISMYEDTPEELLYDNLEEICFLGQPIGRNILGCEKSLKTFTKAKITDYMDKRYTADNMVISAAGNFDEEQFFDLAEKYFGNIKAKTKTDIITETPIYTVGKRTVCKEFEQAHIGIAFKGVSEISEDSYPLSVVHHILGAGMSSRLYQRIREELGLAYSVDSGSTFFADCGFSSVYAAVSPENLDRAIEEITKEINKLKKEIGPGELARAAEQVKSSVILSQEGTSGKVSTFSKQLLFYGKIQTDEEYIEKINKVTLADAERVVEKYFDFSEMNIVVVKPN